MNGGRFHCGREMLGKSGRVGSRNVHRTCTGNAERRRPVSGFEFSFLSSQFSVLSSQFAVEGSLRRKVAFGVVVFLSLVSSLLGQIAGTKVVALRCGNLFDGRGDSLRRNVVIVIEGE